MLPCKPGTTDIPPTGPQALRSGKTPPGRSSEIPKHFALPGRLNITTVRETEGGEKSNRRVKPINLYNQPFWCVSHTLPPALVSRSNEITPGNDLLFWFLTDLPSTRIYSLSPQAYQEAITAPEIWISSGSLAPTTEDISNFLPLEWLRVPRTGTLGILALAGYCCHSRQEATTQHSSCKQLPVLEGAVQGPL